MGLVVAKIGLILGIISSVVFLLLTLFAGFILPPIGLLLISVVGLYICHRTAQDFKNSGLLLLIIALGMALVMPMAVIPYGLVFLGAVLIFFQKQQTTVPWARVALILFLLLVGLLGLGYFLMLRQYSQ